MPSYLPSVLLISRHLNGAVLIPGVICNSTLPAWLKYGEVSILLVPSAQVLKQNYYYILY